MGLEEDKMEIFGSQLGEVWGKAQNIYKPVIIVLTYWG